MFADETAVSDIPWYVCDHRNSSRDVAALDGTPGDQAEVVNHLTYDSFGNVVDADDPTTSTASDGDLPGTTRQHAPQRGYTGREPDAVTGLIYYRARWYDPAMGRFISEDPIGFAAGDTNLSRYVGNSSPNAVDPSGLIDPAFTLPWSGIPIHVQQQQNRVDNYAGINGVARAAVNTVTLGGISDFEAVTPPPDVRHSWSYDQTVAAHQCVVEFGIGFGVGAAAAAPGRTGKLFLGFDAAQNLSNTGQGLYNKDPWQTGFGLLGASGNLGGLSRSQNRFDGSSRLAAECPDPTTNAASQINPRLTQRLEAFRAYKANGGTMDMAQWVKHTKANPNWGTGPNSGYAKWIRSVESVHGNSKLSPQTAYLYRHRRCQRKSLEVGNHSRPELSLSAVLLAG